MTTPASVDRVRAAFEAVCGPGKPSGQWILFCCPCHDDTHESAAITYNAAAGRAVVRCFAGCDDRSLLEAVGLQIRDLYDEPIQSAPRGTRRPRRRTTSQPTDNPSQSVSAAEVAARKAAAEAARGRQLGDPELVTSYRYDFVDGTPAGSVCRYVTHYEHADVKTFLQLHWNRDTKRFVFGGFEPVLYRLPEVNRAIANHQTIHIVEGEKDAERARQVGLVATCNAMGAGSFTIEHAQQLHGAHEVVIVADRDIPGYRHAATVAALLTEHVQNIRIVEAATGKDLSDHLDAGLTLDQLAALTLAELAHRIEAAAHLGTTGSRE